MPASVAAAAAAVAVAGHADSALQQALAASGLELLGTFEGLSAQVRSVAQHSALLEDFSSAELDVLGSALLRIRAQPGQALITEGERGDWMLLVLHGTVDVTKRVARPSAGPQNSPALEPNPEPAPERLAVVKSGAALGEMSMLDGEPRYATCTAIDAVEAGLLTRAAVALLIRDQPAVGAKLLVKITQLLAQRLRNTSNQLVSAVAERKQRDLFRPAG